ncbi:MAG: DNA cytosine methyltransferase [Clostridia bacterium]
MLKVIELFAGLGSQTQALKNIGVEHEVVAISEIDKYAVQSYEALHGKANNLGDDKYSWEKLDKVEELKGLIGRL